MVDLKTLEQSASVINSEQDEPVIQFPLKLWEAYRTTLELEQLKPATFNQAAQLLQLMDEWSHEPEETPAAWWDEFDEFIRNHRLNLADSESDKHE